MEIPKITEQQRAEFEVAFKLFDRNDEGIITKQTLTDLMKELGQEPTAQEIEDMINEVDADGNGKIELDEFITLMSRNIEKHDTEAEYRELFSIFDQKSQNKIGRDDLKKVLLTIGEDVTDQDIDEIMQEADLDGSHFITYEEFVRMMSGKIN